MICVPSNPRLPYLWKIACFSNGGADCRWQAWRVVRWVGTLNGSSVQQGLRPPAASHKPFVWQWLASWSQEKSLHQVAVSVSAGILARNGSWHVPGREVCLAELPRCIVLGLLFFPGFSWWLVTALHVFPFVCVLSQWYPLGVLVGWGLGFVIAMKVGRYFWTSYCVVTCKASAFMKHLYREVHFNNFSIFSAPERNAQKLALKN